MFRATVAQFVLPHNNGNRIVSVAVRFEINRFLVRLYQEMSRAMDYRAYSGDRNCRDSAPSFQQWASLLRWGCDECNDLR